MITLGPGLGYPLGLGSSEGGRCFFDCTTVVILVSGQCRSPSKRLLAIGIRALVRALASVNSSMTSQGAAIAKGLKVTLVSKIQAMGRTAIHRTLSQISQW